MKKNKIDVMSIFSQVEKMAEEYNGNKEVVVNISSHHAVKRTASFMCINVSVGEKMEAIFFSPFTTNDEVDLFLGKVRSLTHNN
jgi:hypothetical protein